MSAAEDALAAEAALAAVRALRVFRFSAPGSEHEVVLLSDLRAALALATPTTTEEPS